MKELMTSEVLDLAADEIEARGWARGIGWDFDLNTQDPLCLEGAIGVAAGIRGRTEIDYNICPAGQAVREYLDLPRQYDPLRGRPLFRWNDASGRTEEEVIEVLRAAAAVERTKEAVAGYSTDDQPLPLEVGAA